MQLSPQVAVYVLLLIPGLLGHAVFCAFTYTEKPTWSGRVVVAIVLSGAAYVSLACLRLAPGLAWLPDPHALVLSAENGLAQALSASNIGCVVLASALAFVYSLGLVWAHNRRTLHRLANTAGLTTKTGFINEWDSVMIQHARTRWVVVAMKDGTSFVGWLKSHDVSADDRCIVLEKVRQQDKDDNGLDWPPQELLVLDSMADVRYLRLVPRQEKPNEHTSEQSDTASEHRDEIREYKPEPSASGSAASSANTANLIAGKVEQVGPAEARKETQDVRAATTADE